MTAQEIISTALSVGAGSGGIGLAAWSIRGLVTAVEKALPSIVAAFKARSDAKARALKLAAETAAKAQAHDDRVYDDLRRDIDDLRQRLDDSEEKGRRCEEMYTEAMGRADQAMRVSIRQQREIESLMAFMSSRGMTPSDMPAVRPRMTDGDEDG